MRESADASRRSAQLEGAIRSVVRVDSPMKTEFTDVSETQKTITIEIPSDVVDAEINRVAKGYTKQARIPGFRPGKVPATLVKQRFREQILHDVMHGLIPRAVEEALQERGIEPVDTPNIKDVALEEGQPLKFTAAIETVPPFDPGDLSHDRRVAPAPARSPTRPSTRRCSGCASARRSSSPSKAAPSPTATPSSLDIERTRRRAAKPIATRTSASSSASPAIRPDSTPSSSASNAGDEKTFTIHFPEDYAVKELAGHRRARTR